MISLEDLEHNFSGKQCFMCCLGSLANHQRQLNITLVVIMGFNINILV